MANCGIDVVQSDASDSEESSNTISTINSEIYISNRKLIKSSSSYENIYDKANLQATLSEEAPSTEHLSEVLGDPIHKTVLPPEMCSSFENIYMSNEKEEPVELIKIRSKSLTPPQTDVNFMELPEQIE